MPRVSVVVPNFNYARYLDTRLRSVLAQTYQDFEVIYLDDASTDDSEVVFARYAGDRRVRAIHNEVNSGSPFVQWNRGVGEARGEYVWIAEADDAADPRLLESLVARLDAHPTAGLAYCQSLRVDGGGAVRGSWDDWTQDLDPMRWRADFFGAGRDECARFLVQKNTIPNASAVLLRRSVYEAAGGADSRLRLCGDWMLWVNMLLRSDVAFVAEPLNRFRAHAASVAPRRVRDGTYAEEAYLVLRHVRRHVRVAPADREQARRLRFHDWRSALLDPEGRVPWSRNLRIYARACREDPRLNGRLLRSLGALIRVRRRYFQEQAKLA